MDCDFLWSVKTQKIIGVEPEGAPSMTNALKNNKPKETKLTDNFVDGATVSMVGEINFNICKDKLSKILTIKLRKEAVLLNIQKKFIVNIMKTKKYWFQTVKI